jgi:hypothetical protein
MLDAPIEIFHNQIEKILGVCTRADVRNSEERYKYQYVSSGRQDMQ